MMTDRVKSHIFAITAATALGLLVAIMSWAIGEAVVGRWRP
jgi:hypothetical protein